MIAPIILVLISAAGVAACLLRPELSDLLMLAGPSLIASLYLLLRAILPFRPSLQKPVAKGAIRPRKPSAPIFGAKKHLPARQNWIVIDGSNVLFWKDNAPNIATVREVIAQLQNLGYTAGAVFDANVGYKIAERYIDDAELALMLNLPADRTLVVPKGSIADETVLNAARSIGAKVLTNDRYRDWLEKFPEVASPGHLIQGGYRGGQLWLDLGAAPMQKRAS